MDGPRERSSLITDATRLAYLWSIGKQRLAALRRFLETETPWRLAPTPDISRISDPEAFFTIHALSLMAFVAFAGL